MVISHHLRGEYRSRVYPVNGILQRGDTSGDGLCDATEIMMSKIRCMGVLINIVTIIIKIENDIYKNNIK
jgi:hypothetical protein